MRNADAHVRADVQPESAEPPTTVVKQGEPESLPMAVEPSAMATTEEMRESRSTAERSDRLDLPSIISTSAPPPKSRAPSVERSRYGTESGGKLAAAMSAHGISGPASERSRGAPRRWPMTLTN